MPSQALVNEAISAARAALRGTTVINLNLAAERTDWSPDASGYPFLELTSDYWPVLYLNANQRAVATVPLRWFRSYLLIPTSAPSVPRTGSFVMLVSGSIVCSLDLLNVLTEYDRAATLYAACLADRFRRQARIDHAFATTAPPSTIQSHYRARSRIIRPLP